MEKKWKTIRTTLFGNCNKILLNRINIKNGNIIKFKDYSIIDQIITFPD